MFGKSARKVWDLVSKHHEYVFECFENFESVFKNHMSNNVDGVAEDAKKVAECEEQARLKLREVVKAFLGGSFLPSTRKELLQIAKMNTTIARMCKKISNELVRGDFFLPKEAGDRMVEMISLTKQQLAALSKAQELLFSNFEQLIKDEETLQIIRDYEQEVDEIQEAIIVDIYKGDMKFSEKWSIRYFANKIADFSDHIEEIADEIEIMVILRKV